MNVSTATVTVPKFPRLIYHAIPCVPHPSMFQWCNHFWAVCEVSLELMMTLTLFIKIISGSDEIIPFPPVQQYVDQQCAQGADINMIAQAVGEHSVTDVINSPAVMNFIQKAFNGSTDKVTCGTNQAATSLTINSPNVDDIISPATATSLRQALSKIPSIFNM